MLDRVSLRLGEETAWSSCTRNPDRIYVFYCCSQPNRTTQSLNFFFPERAYFRCSGKRLHTVHAPSQKRDEDAGLGRSPRKRSAISSSVRSLNLVMPRVGSPTTAATFRRFLRNTAARRASSAGEAYRLPNRRLKWAKAVRRRSRPPGRSQLEGQ